MNIRPKTVNLLEEKIGSKLFDISLEFFWIWHQKQSNKSNNKQVGLYQTKKLLHSEGNFQGNKKATYGTGENICKLFIWNGLISKIYKKFIQLNSKKMEKSD